jgi:ABC-type transport system involved in cytochrome bd biosynthesis fused ATPase/permease subunit
VDPVADDASPTPGDGERSVQPPWRIRAPRALLVATLLVGVATAAANVLLYWLVARWLVGDEVAGGATLAVLLALLALRAGLTMGGRLIGGRISVRVRRETRARLFERVCAGGPDLVRARGVGPLHEMLTDKVEALDPYFSLYLPQLVIGLVAPVAILALLVAADPLTGLGLLAVVPIVPLLLGTVQKRFRVVGRKYAKAAAELSSVVLHGIRSLSTLTVFGRVADYERRLRAESASLRRQTVRLLAINQLALLIVELFFSLVVVLVATVLAVERHAAGALPAALALAMPLIAIELTRPINLVGAFFFAGAVGRQAKGDIERFLTEVPPPAPPGRASAAVESTGLVLDGVSFAYPRAPGRPVLDGLSFRVDPGEVVALVGASGTGKSTVAKLLAGLYRTDAGDLLADGIPLNALTREDRARTLSYLPQRPYVFAMSLRDNVRLAVPDAADEDVHRALAAAGLEPLLARLPEGLDTPITEDASNLSGGERMRLSLARALLAGARYLVLDEPTAEVDGVAEAGILDHLNGLGDRTGVLLIAHRRSTIDAAQRVVRLPDRPAVEVVHG